MLPREVGYARPSTLAEALGLLAENDGARALAGGQTLVNVMKARAASPDALVDLASLGELRGIELGSDGSLEIGSMTTCTEIVESAEARARPILGEVCGQIADVQVRNRGTIGGNICANDPTNHLPPLMVALGARMTIAGSDGERSVDADDFFLGVYMTEVGPGEILTKIAIPPGRRDGFAAVTIGADGTCIVSAAVSLDGSTRIAIGCVGAVPHRATDVEAKLNGDFGEVAARAAVEGLGATLDPPGDVHAPASYRQRVAEVVVARAIVEAGAR
ncbi:MAG TPA: xanthine dehydrogenase family protein subunit M [Gaiellaceae bacterium]